MDVEIRNRKRGHLAYALAGLLQEHREEVCNTPAYLATFTQLGQILADGAVDAPEVVLATCDRDAIERQRQGWPFLRDRRIDTYHDLTRCLVDERTASEPPSDET